MKQRRARRAWMILVTPLAGCALAFGSSGGTASGTGDGSPAVMQGVVPFAIVMAAALLIAIVWWGDD